MFIALFYSADSTRPEASGSFDNGQYETYRSADFQNRKTVTSY